MPRINSKSTHAPLERGEISISRLYIFFWGVNIMFHSSEKKHEIQALYKCRNDKTKMLKVKRMQTSGTEAIRTQIKPSKPKREITKITNSKIQREHIVNCYGEQLFPKTWPLSNPYRTNNYMNTCETSPKL